LTPEIPQAEMDRLRPLVDRLLAELRRHTQLLPSERDSALTYEVSREPAQ
jgi:hypothetical protein